MLCPKLSVGFALVGLLGCGFLINAVSGACSNLTARKEWRALDVAERTAFISAVKCLSKIPHGDSSSLAPTVFPGDIPPVITSSSFYDDIVYVHMDLNRKIHNTGLFLPWHRWYIHSFESALKSKCAFSGSLPYWDWTQDAGDFFGSTMFSDNDTKSGLGGWGDASADFTIPGGGFAKFELSYPSWHTLRRNFTLQAFVNAPAAFTPDPNLFANTSFTQDKVDALVNGYVGEFKEFQKELESTEGMHSAIHLIMGGDLGGTCPRNAAPGCVPGPTWSANEPLFFLHHAMIDKIWADWQSKSPNNADAFFGGSVQHLENITIYNEYPTGGPPWLSKQDTMPADGLFPAAKIEDMLSTTGDALCYQYA